MTTYPVLQSMCSHHSSYHTDIELHWWWKHQRHRCRVLCSKSDRNYPHHIFLKMARNVAVSLSVHPSLKCLLNKCFISDSRLQSWRQILGDFQQKAWERSRLELIVMNLQQQYGTITMFSLSENAIL